VFGIEIDTCQRCGGTLRIIASIEQPEVIRTDRPRTVGLRPGLACTIHEGTDLHGHACKFGGVEA
jgi:hypothetical protein